MQGEYSGTVDEFTIIDCRYPYEYQGGHIRGAMNLWNKDLLVERFFKELHHPSDNKRSIFIYHCEFSSKRGPDMWVNSLALILIFYASFKCPFSMKGLESVCYNVLVCIGVDLCERWTVRRTEWPSQSCTTQRSTCLTRDTKTSTRSTQYVHLTFPLARFASLYYLK